MRFGMTAWHVQKIISNAKHSIHGKQQQSLQNTANNNDSKRVIHIYKKSAAVTSEYNATIQFVSNNRCLLRTVKLVDRI